MPSEIAILREKRQIIIKKLERISLFIENIQPTNTNKHELQARINKCEQISVEFETIQNEFESKSSVNPEQHESDRDNFEKLYFNVVGKIGALLEIITCPILTETPKRETQIEVKLPNIDLPKFAGNYDHWLTFSDTFESLINKNAKLSDIQRFHYLKSCLVGEAAKVVLNLPISEANYAAAWELLKARFQNLKLIIKTHVNALFNIPVVVKPTAFALRQLLDSTNSNLRTLEKLNLPVNSWDVLIVHLIISKLDYKTSTEWEEKASEIPTWQQLSDFLYKKCQTLDAIDSNLRNSPSTVKNSNKIVPQKLSVHLLNKQSCPICNSTHYIQQCDKFLGLSPPERLTEIQNLKRCTNCLRPGHKTTNCTSSFCRKCNKRHNTLLHFEHTPPKPESFSNSENPEDPPVNALSVSKFQTFENVLLSTAIVNLKDFKGKTHPFTAILDSGSQASFITEFAFRQLKLKAHQSNQTIIGIGRVATKANKSASIEVNSRTSLYKTKLNFLVMPNLTNYRSPVPNSNRSRLNIPPDIKLADPNFDKTTHVDLILGNDVFFKLLCIGQIQLRDNLPVLQNTKLGWIVAGPCATNTKPNTVCCNITNQILHDEITKFWELEIIDKPSQKLSSEDEQCEELFLNSHTRLPNGQFMVRLPFKSNSSKLGSSREIAVNRLHAMERKFKKSDSLKALYHNFINEYRDLNHMEPSKNLNVEYFLPHHAVLRECSITTKLRVVFDASVKSSYNSSLNENLLIGPQLQNELYDVLLQFRLPKYVMTADITKMYRQILVHPNDRKYQTILWRDNINVDPQPFQLNTVTYGTSCAPYLAIRCLHQLANENAAKFPKASSAIKSDFYVDDLLTGCDSIEEIIQLRNEINNILISGGFSLAKWASNDPIILFNNANVEPTTQPIINIHKDDTRTLGIQWNYSQDTFKFNFHKVILRNKLTKRVLLSNIAKMFDPLGLLSPVIAKAKLLMQRLWLSGVDWDQPVPLDIYTLWNQLADDLKTISTLNIPRRILSENSNSIQLHGFCDASESAYGACIYLRHPNSTGSYTSRLLTSKSKLAPLKKTTLPRLELCGALLLAQLITKVKSIFDKTFDEEYLWCDSTIALAWIATPPHLLKTFVSNRVSEIQSLTKQNSWNHVSSIDNAADIISRGANPSQLIQNTLWWEGPKWLKLEVELWPKQTNKREKSIPELKPQAIVSSIALANDNEILKLIENCSNLDKLKRVLAYCFRFKHNVQNHHKNRLFGQLTTDEIKNGFSVILKTVQYHSFHDDILALQNKKQLSNKSKLLSLCPFLDADGLLRVGGRLKNATISYNAKYPILIPQGHCLTKLILRDIHERHYHVNPLSLLNITRNQFWPIAGRSTARQIVRNCVQCAKFNAQPNAPIMGDLPASRLTPSRPFTACGIDFAGPFFIREGRTRGRKIVKSYLCVFVCFATKAVHLEIVSDLSTEACLAALRRSVSRRGLCSDIYSDNATNFVGAKRELRNLVNLFLSENENQAIINFLTNHSIKWHFIPARSPHFGGLWEAAVKSAKRLFSNIFSNAYLTFEELSTVFCEIEAILNSRPLSPLSSDPTDLIPLTPAHFLIGESLLAIPEPQLLEIPVNRLSRFQYLQKLQQEFWKRWSTEYLGNLQTRNKWQLPESNHLSIGSLVLLRESSPPLMWRLGRIMELFPGNDGVPRVASVKTQSGVIKRAIHKLCALPVPTITDP